MTSERQSALLARTPWKSTEWVLGGSSFPSPEDDHENENADEDETHPVRPVPI